jgi:RNA polymerase sigma-70 factor (ECF subfamily)
MQDRNQSDTSVSLIARLGADAMDQEAWERFVDRYGPRILGWCRSWRLQEADAQDVAQTVLMKMGVQIRRIQYDPSRSFRGWLRTISRHAWSDVVSARRPDAGSGETVVVGLLQGVEAREDLVRRLEEQFDLELLEAAAQRVRQRVAPQTWEAYRLTTVEGRNGAEAAALLGMKIASVFMAKSNILRMLRDEVRELEGPTVDPDLPDDPDV